MSVDLSKCKAGDKVELRNGKIVALVENFCSDRDKYPFAHKGYQSNWHGVDINGKSCIGDNECDIIRIIGKDKKKPCRKVVKCRIMRKDNDWWFSPKLANVDWFSDTMYSSQKNCIRGARRFCKRIGFECVIIYP